MRLGIHKSAIDEVRIIFVASSIGCAIARLYASEYPRTVSALLLLDSIIANSDAVSLLPDPQSPGFSEGGLPEGITVELLYDARQKVGRYYHPNTPNKEGLWWGNLPTLLPHSDTPQLRGPNTRTPYVTVMEHDRDVWCAEAEKVRSSVTAKLRYSSA
jgi:pimeloyl-ACP methyl ester carboxylesterase